MYALIGKGLQDILVKNTVSNKRGGGVMNSASLRRKKCIRVYCISFLFSKGI